MSPLELLQGEREREKDEQLPKGEQERQDPEVKNDLVHVWDMGFFYYSYVFPVN